LWVALCRGHAAQAVPKGTHVQTGTVKWFNSQKGYGFIQPSAGGPDVFVHISAVERAGLPGLKDGQKVSYEIVTDRRSGKASADQLRAE
jgi:CspA family cold shock protein